MQVAAVSTDGAGKLRHDLLLAEQTKLRAELAHLKDCQLRYYSLSVAATGVLVSIGTQLPPKSESSVYYLAPLLIVVPCWWIFFDKATTITRIVGYLRLLDDFFRHSNDRYAPRHLGWETALQLRRSDKEASRPSGAVEWTKGYKIALKEVLPLKTGHRYWGFTWYTFFFLSATCLALAWLSSGPTFSKTYLALVATSAIVFVTTLYNLYLVGDLAGGRRSYEHNYSEWCRTHAKSRDWEDIWAKGCLDQWEDEAQPAPSPTPAADA